MTVAIAAPDAPNFGINIIFKIILITADSIVVVAIICVDLAAEKILPIKAVKVLNIVAITRIDEYLHAIKKTSKYKKNSKVKLIIIIP